MHLASVKIEAGTKDSGAVLDKFRPENLNNYSPVLLKKAFLFCGSQSDERTLRFLKEVIFPLVCRAPARQLPVSCLPNACWPPRTSIGQVSVKIS